MKDAIVPFASGLRLYKYTQSVYKPWWVENGHHTNIVTNFEKEYYSKLSAFIAFCLQQQKEDSWEILSLCYILCTSSFLFSDVFYHFLELFRWKNMSDFWNSKNLWTQFVISFCFSPRSQIHHVFIRVAVCCIVQRWKTIRFGHFVFVNRKQKMDLIKDRFTSYMKHVRSLENGYLWNKQLMVRILVVFISNLMGRVWTCYQPYPITLFLEVRQLF